MTILLIIIIWLFLVILMTSFAYYSLRLSLPGSVGLSLIFALFDFNIWYSNELAYGSTELLGWVIVQGISLFLIITCFFILCMRDRRK